MPDYREIYNQIVTEDVRLSLAENSLGLRALIKATDSLRLISGRSLDIGCSLGFAVEYLSGPPFQFRAFGIDVSDEAIVKAIERTRHIGGLGQRFYARTQQTLPFEDDFFHLITCFDVLAHLDESDIDKTLSEIKRIGNNNCTSIITVSCCKSAAKDKFGDNLHRTVKSPDWWIEKVDPDFVEYDCQEKQLTMWTYNRVQSKKQVPGKKPRDT